MKASQVRAAFENMVLSGQIQLTRDRKARELRERFRFIEEMEGEQ